MTADLTLGVISDTHGLLRPEALLALEGSDLILHAGDVGRPGILDQLADIAPVRAVRGNIDKGAWAEVLPESDVVDTGSHLLYMLHNLDELDLSPEAAGFAAVIYGHSHKPETFRRQGVLYLNPGSAGPRRFSLPVSIARLELQSESLVAQLIEIGK
ncbi:MAG TPA: metallophosphoesterase family protein [Trueperaceae bacterium]